MAIKIIFILSLTLLVLMLSFVVHKLALSDDEAMNRFYTNQVSEDQIMDPLILRGEKVLKVLHSEIKNRDMDRRRYAIGALGNIGSKTSLPILESIFLSDTELDYFRCDAIKSAAMIDLSYAQKIIGIPHEAIALCNEEMLLEYSVGDHMDDIFNMKRSFLSALIGIHK